GLAIGQSLDLDVRNDTVRGLDGITGGRKRNIHLAVLIEKRCRRRTSELRAEYIAKLHRPHSYLLIVERHSNNRRAKRRAAVDVNRNLCMLAGLHFRN